MKSQAVDLIKQHGIFGLSRMDGCACANFEVQNIAVEVCCHRTSRDGLDGPAVIVSSTHMDVTEDELREVAAAVLKSLRSHWRYTKVNVRTKLS